LRSTDGRYFWNRETGSFFTGGVTEGLNAKDEEFGDEQLIEVANACRGDDASMIQQQIIDCATCFCGAICHDDFTVIVVGRNEVGADQEDRAMRKR
jgi:serine phosphatase RsbU (regulator of sigma subunit)